MAKNTVRAAQNAQVEVRQKNPKEISKNKAKNKQLTFFICLKQASAPEANFYLNFPFSFHFLIAFQLRSL
jgi:hypothetical protein